jgi:hypothetical protein
MPTQFTITNARKYIDTNIVIDSNNNSIVNEWTMYDCEFDSNGVSSWCGDIPFNEPILTPTSELVQRLIDVYGIALIGKTIVIDLDNVDGNIVRLT